MAHSERISVIKVQVELTSYDGKNAVVGRRVKETAAVEADIPKPVMDWLKGRLDDGPS